MLKSVFTHLLMLAGISLAQAQIVGKSVPSFTTQGGTVLHKGDTVRIGRGSGTNGSLRYIFIPSNVFTGTPQKFFTSNLAGSAALIKDLKTTDSGTYGIQTVAVIKGEGLLSGCIVINPAEEAGEIRTKSAQRLVATAAAPTSSGSVTDELLKLKQLLDAKLITPAEFAAQKNRLLKQQVDAVPSKTNELSGKIQTANDLVFKLVSAVGDRKSQMVTVTVAFTNKAANKTDFNTSVQSCTNADGDEFRLKSSLVGKGYEVTLFTDAPTKGTYSFGGILPKTSSIKLLSIPYRYRNEASSRSEEGQVEFRDISIVWK